MNINKMAEWSTRKINAAFREADESYKWPINNKFNATERAILHIRKTQLYSGGLEYAAALDSEIGQIVNEELSK